MKPIVLVPNDVLITPAETVTSFDGKLIQLIADMKETLIAAVEPKGVGLAASQIGVSLRVFVTRPTESATIRAFVNPEIIRISETKKTSSSKGGKLEGCLSIPKIWGNVHRSHALTLRYQDERGKTHEEEFTGFPATIIQHETDHTNGILYTRRVLEQHDKLYQSIIEDGKEVLEEIRLP